jgi:hypothetical protein
LLPLDGVAKTVCGDFFLTTKGFFMSMSDSTLRTLRSNPRLQGIYEDFASRRERGGDDFDEEDAMRSSLRDAEWFDEGERGWFQWKDEDEGDIRGKFSQLFGGVDDDVSLSPDDDDAGGY